MSYNKTTWQAGDTITAEKLNKIEDALAELLDGASGVPQDAGEVTHSTPRSDDIGK